MPYYVCKGAKLKCSMGSDQSDLEVVHLERPVRVCGQFKASIMDHKPLMNIKPFGQCKSLANPVVASATAANYGRLQEMPCIPNTQSPWVNGKMNVFVKGNPALLDCSKCMCLWAGVIEITDPGQKLMSCGSSGLGSQGIGATAGAQNVAATPGNGLALQGAGIASQVSPSTVVPQSTGAVVAVNTTKLQVKKMEGAAETYPRQKVVYKVTEYNKKRCKMSNEDKNEVVTWKVKAGNDDMIITDLVDEGEKIILYIDKEWEGEEISVIAYIGNIEETIPIQKTKVLKDPWKTVLIRGVIGEEEAFPWQKIKYEVTNSNKDDDAGKMNDDSEIKWAIKVDKDGKDGDIDKNMLKDKKGEKIITLEMKEEWGGGEIFVMPYLHNPTKTVSVKTNVKSKYKMIVPGSIIIAESERSREKNKDGTTADDMLYGDMTKDILLTFFKNSTIEIPEEFKGTDYHFREFKDMATSLFAMDGVEFYEPIFSKNLNRDYYLNVNFTHNIDLESNIISMIDHFRDGRGMDYSNPDLTAAVMSHNNTIQFFNKIRKEFLKELIDREGDITKVKIKQYDSDELPAYNTWADRLEGLSIAINGTWAFKVQVNEYVLEEDKSYRGKMKIVIYDHFGLDKYDVSEFSKPGHWFEGFFHWFVLQRWEGFGKKGQREKYMPFVTVIEKELPFKGNWKYP